MIPYGRHNINEDDISAVINALRGDWLTTGPLVEAFELALEGVVGAPCVAVSSGTAALHCAYAAIDLKPGDEIITPPITFIATQATATFFGAKVVFADIQLDTANIDPKFVESVITSKTKAIVAVDYAGHPADLDELRIIADKYGVFLIEDAAHSLASTYKKRRVGSIADITTFSFFPTKNITTGEGGAVASIKPELLEKAKRFSRQGLVRNAGELMMSNEGPWHQEVQRFGLNYRLPDILCALGIAQLNRLPIFKDVRDQVFKTYLSELSETPHLELPSKRDYVDPMWHLYPIRVPSKGRRKIFERLQQNNIKVQVNYLPANQHPVFTDLGYKGSDTPNADKFYRSEISLPMMANSDYLSSSAINSICGNLKLAMKEFC
jgi:dTDP-4-amino-4,6-dideoxygalactose transaminase